jgi:RNA polymerase sigma factor (sigma-70 family)
MTDTKDYLIEIRVKNNHLLKKISAAGYGSVAEFARAVNLTPGIVGNYVTLKSPAVDRWGKWRKSVERMAELLKCLPEDLFPPQHIDKALKTSKATIEAGIEEVAVFLTGGEDTARTALEHITREEALNCVSKSLTELEPREERVLRLRFGIDCHERTLDEAGRMLGMTGSRVRQIEARALRKLKHPQISKDVREAAAGLGIVPRYSNEPVARHYVPEWKK